MKFVGGVLHVTLAMHHMVQITWHMAVPGGNFYSEQLNNGINDEFWQSERLRYNDEELKFFKIKISMA